MQSTNGLSITDECGGVVLLNGHIIRIPPRGPEFELGQAMVALDAARNIGGPAGDKLTRSVFDAIGSIAKVAGKRGQV